MKKVLNLKMLLSAGLCMVLAAELFVLADAAVVCHGGMLPLYAPVFVVPMAALIFFACFREHWKRILTIVVLIPVILGLAAGLGYAGWKTFSINAAYAHPDSGKHQFYGDKNVMVIVPHQDDELNLAGGVMEEYVRYGSDVRVIFVTNGDYVVPAETRIDEALAVCSAIGIPDDHVLFLGYGNEWKKDGPHIYNADADTVIESYAGRTETYAAAAHRSYRQGRPYTRENLEEDLKSVILEYAPDTVFCTDYDHHIDHKAVSLLFEKVMGNILKENPDYTPVVYKGYAYGTAWETEADYYTANVLSTKNPFGAPYNQKPEVYRWEDRVRLPVAGYTLSRSLVSSEAYQLLELHESQGAVSQADRVINGDKVFWQRNTGSLVLGADVTASSGKAELLHDFMLTDNHDLVDAGRLPYDGVWIPEAEDTVRTVSVTLKDAADISEIVLYDHPSELDNILNASIVFDDGTCVETGPLVPGGAATSIPVNKEDVSAFSVSLLETQGDMAGLSELEALPVSSGTDSCFIKLMDRDGNFVYDYQTVSDGMAEFMLYTCGNLPEVTEENYSVAAAGTAGTAEFDGGIIRITCPAGETMTLNVTCSDADVSDSIVIRNPGALARMWSGLWVNVEKKVYSHFICSGSGFISNLNLFRIWERVCYLIRHI